jgi:hypothetical protein
MPYISMMNWSLVFEGNAVQARHMLLLLIRVHWSIIQLKTELIDLVVPAAGWQPPRFGGLL